MNHNDDQEREERFEQVVERMRQEHNAPPAIPRDRMWERIDAARAARRARAGVVRPEFAGRPPSGAGRAWRLAAAAAAILVLGIGVGRMWPGPDAPRGPVAGSTDEGSVATTADPTPRAPGSGTVDRSSADPLFERAAVDLFGRADALLTEFRADGCGDERLAPVPGWARDMLVQTRLLLGAGATAEQVGENPLRPLLLELELVLVQISGLTGEDCRQETEWIRDGLEKRSTVERLRLAAATGTERPL